jgi:hypothetical protein
VVGQGKGLCLASGTAGARYSDAASASPGARSGDGETPVRAAFRPTNRRPTSMPSGGDPRRAGARAREPDGRAWYGLVPQRLTFQSLDGVEVVGYLLRHQAGQLTASDANDNFTRRRVAQYRIECA